MEIYMLKKIYNWKDENKKMKKRNIGDENENR